MRIYSFLTSSKRLLQLSGLLFTFSVSYISEAQNDLSAKMSVLLRDPIIQKSQVGISIRNTATGEIVYDYNGSKSFTPASNLKLLTTSAAISLLGPDYTFKTPLQYSGELINGNFKGILKIIGSGDPTLGSDKIPGNSSYSEMIRRWVGEIKKTGISTFS
jgi:D-alanyl-D-alanine carboxypeptidase/D-alanyl-D-alanine-endopeptidase (penicillin-binding protein 4)